MKKELLVLNEERNVTLTAYIQETGGEFEHITRRPAVLVLPGGGYQYCSNREADPIAFAYLKAGYHAFVLRYSAKEDAVWPAPLNDYEQAMETIRAHTEEWKLYPDRVAVIGFSAGGHLAACAAAMAKNRPNAAILGYAVTTGDSAKEWCPTAPDVISAVDASTCPCFLFATRDDSIVPVENTLQMLNALCRADISFESHIYAYGTHGFSLGDTTIQSMDNSLCRRAPHWVADSIGWLKDIFGDFCPSGMTAPACRPHVSEDGAAFLSIDCTMGHLMENPEACKVLESLFSQFPQPDVPDNSETANIGKRMKLRDILQIAT